MKKRIFSICLVVLSFIFMFTGCDFSSSDDETATYTILYSDGKDSHTITVKKGDVYEIAKPLPQKEGYDFAGLFDSEIGGAQYVSASGFSLATFGENRNLVLYPQFTPKEYKIVLDYGEAEVNSDKTAEVTMDSSFPSLPSYLYIKDKYHMNFTGWYAGDREVKICGEDGISDKTFDTSFLKYCNGNTLTLKAGFDIQTYPVHFYTNDHTLIGTVNAEYGASIETVAEQVTVDGRVIKSWSKRPYGTKFTGIVESELSLYPLIYPVHFCREDSTPIETVYAELGEGIDSVSELITVEGKVIKSWSKTPYGQKFTGNIEGETTLYSLLYPVHFCKGDRTPIKTVYAESGVSLDTVYGEVSVDGKAIRSWSETPYGEKFTGNIERELTLYALIYPVRFCKGDSTPIKTVYAELGESIDSVASGISVDGEVIRSWSKTPYGKKFSGNVEGETTLYALVYGSYKKSFTVHNCADNNGYDINQQAGEADDRSRHDGFSVAELYAENIDVIGGRLIQYEGVTPTFRLKVLEDPNSLPINNDECQVKHIEDDDYTGAVKGTNISGDRIGNGAYYVKVNYKDGTYSEANALNILSGKKKGDYIDLPVSIDTNKKIKSVEVTVVYEIYSGAQKGIFGKWWHEYSNWRCSATFEFV